MGRTNIVIDDRLVAKAMKVSGKRTKRETVNYALQRLVDSYEVLSLKQLRGKGLIDPAYDYKRARAG